MKKHPKHNESPIRPIRSTVEVALLLITLYNDILDIGLLVLHIKRACVCYPCQSHYSPFLTVTVRKIRILG